MSEGANISLLVVDDFEPGRYVRTRVLQQAGFHVFEATTGKDALRQIAEHQPALVLLDVNLPDMDGFTVCRTIKKNPATARTMVLQISAHYTSTNDQIHGLEDGADGYIPGDVAPELLVALVRALLRTLRAEDALRDREERLQLVQALERSQEELRALAASVLTAQEEERRRVARELHDDLSQQLAVLEVELTQLRLQPPEFAAHLDAAIARSRVLSRAMRDISHRLHPGILEHLGLQTALCSLCEEWERAHRRAVHFVCETPVPDIDVSTATVLYRITQEALRNVAKHAGEALVTVTLSCTGQQLHLSIQDDGCGFDPDTRRESSGLGLLSMQERARLVAGVVTLRSAPGAGTEVNACVPWNKQRQAGQGR